MANSLTAFFQTVLAAAEEASQLLAPTWATLDSIYLDYQSEPATIGQTLNVAIPQDPTNNVNDQGVGDLVLSDVGFNTVPIAFTNHPSFGWTIRDYEQFNSPILIRNLFMDAAMKGVKNYINSKITSLFNTSNFPTNSVISTTSHIITTAQFLSANAILADQKVPVANDPENMALILPSTPYMAVVGDNNWTQAQIAGMRTAEYVRATGTMPTAYGMTVKLDQQMPTTGTVGSRTFTGVYMHRWAVAMVTRPLPPGDERVVEVAYVDFAPKDKDGNTRGAGVPLRVMIGYNQYPKQGWIVSIDAGFGLKVVRDNMGQLFSIAE